MLVNLIEIPLIGLYIELNCVKFDLYNVHVSKLYYQ